MCSLHQNKGIKGQYTHSKCAITMYTKANCYIYI